MWLALSGEPYTMCNHYILFCTLCQLDKSWYNQWRCNCKALCWFTCVLKCSEMAHPYFRELLYIIRYYAKQPACHCTLVPSFHFCWSTVVNSFKQKSAHRGKCWFVLNHTVTPFEDEQWIKSWEMKHWFQPVDFLKQQVQNPSPTLLASH